MAVRQNPLPEAPLKEGGTRRSILELAPLELECMNTLWPLGEASVRDIQTGLAPTLPRAYTTIMTIMDRLAQKGIVVRQKSGRAYVYRPSLSAEQARAHAVAQIVQGFFDGSADALAAHLSAGVHVPPDVPGNSNSAGGATRRGREGARHGIGIAFRRRAAAGS